MEVSTHGKLSRSSVITSKAGIKKELIVPYNPQQNRVAERKNMAIVGAARAMLYDQDL
jgi:hypothetical protein